MIAADRALVHEWLTRCIASIGRLPPSQSRDRSLRALTDRLDRLSARPQRHGLTVINGGLSKAA